MLGSWLPQGNNLRIQIHLKTSSWSNLSFGGMKIVTFALFCYCNLSLSLWKKKTKINYDN